MAPAHYGQTFSGLYPSFRHALHFNHCRNGAPLAAAVGGVAIRVPSEGHMEVLPCLQKEQEQTWRLVVRAISLSPT